MEIAHNTFLFHHNVQSHLEFLIHALRDYITDQRKESLMKALNELKKEFDFDPTAIDHLHYALYKFQDAVLTVLRSLNIKPHWMFALENLVKGAVHASLCILSPGKHKLFSLFKKFMIFKRFFVCIVFIIFVVKNLVKI